MQRYYELRGYYRRLEETEPLMIEFYTQPFQDTPFRNTLTRYNNIFTVSTTNTLSLPRRAPDVTPRLPEVFVDILMDVLTVDDFMDWLPQQLQDVKVTLTEEEFLKIGKCIDEKGITCHICLSENEARDTVSFTQLPCRHCFHTHCIKTWLTTEKTTCPLCRKDTREALN